MGLGLFASQSLKYLNMNKKEEQVQKALGTFDHLKCVKCGKVSYRNKLTIISETTITTDTPPFWECVGAVYQCPCGSKDFEFLGASSKLLFYRVIGSSNLLQST